ncbi:hypothetical protein L3X38_011145 [Prunus dulcis]|uniref:Uncharacterized protein n=1 Tax=Prunus dulcis TaxID=3755 RepID=A0AAD4ZEV7_PRUDU|nr:hypothetical protein L3X38_011145 [Prunus dulcis]
MVTCDAKLSKLVHNSSTNPLGGEKWELCTKFQCGTLCKPLWWRHVSWRLGLAFGSFGRCLAPRKCVFLRHGRRHGCLGASRFVAGSARPWKCVFLRHGRRHGCLGASRFVAGTARFIMV